MTEPDWAAARAAVMLDPSVTFLNTGSFGPTPRPVFERVTKLRRHQAEDPMDFIVRATPPLLWRARLRLAEFLGADPTRLLFSQNVSTAINMIASSLLLNGPGEILTSDREYGSMHWCWERAAQNQGLELRTFPLPLVPRSPDELVDVVARAITPQTRLLFFSHVYSANGLVMPAKELCALARRHSVISVVDGAHAPAMIPLAIDDIGTDFYAGNCHKWLLAPMGAGFLVLGRGSVDRLTPLQVSWGYRRDASRGLDEQDEFGSTPRLRQLEFEGSRDVCPWLVVPEAIDFQAALGWENTRGRIAELQTYVRMKLDGYAGLRLTTPVDPRMHGAMSAFWTPAEPPSDQLRQQLWDNKIEALINDWPDGRTLRISTHFYTREEEVERLAQFLRKVLG